MSDLAPSANSEQAQRLSDEEVHLLRAAYRRERDKRIRPEGAAQYTPLDEKGGYLDDPYVAPGFSREPVIEDTEVAILGGGIAGLVAAASLREKGTADIRVIDQAGDFGGTWYWNRYPGVRCDIESYIYMPFLEESGFVPTEKYACGKEILEEIQLVARKYDLYKGALFQTRVEGLRWQEDRRRWLITTQRGDRISARFVVKTNSPLDRPKLPGIPGIQDFAGHIFHTSRWDYNYTGGDSTGGLHKLGDKNVAVIGTGCTGIQCIPYLAEDAKHVYVFQRTPSSVDVRGNASTDRDWFASQPKGWVRARRANFVAAVGGGGHADHDAVNDSWTHTAKKLGGGFFKREGDEGSAVDAELVAELLDFEKMNEIRARVDSIVSDPATAEKLKPWFRQYCKRPGFSDEYLGTFNRTNVSLIDTCEAPIDRITADSIVSGGKEYKVDCIIFATGFDTANSLASRTGYEVYGRDGISLSDHWKDGMRTHYGMLSYGFPNLLHMGITQNGVTYVYTYCMEEQAASIATLINRVQASRASRVEATLEAEQEWVSRIRRSSGVSVDFFRQCTPGYYNTEGDLSKGVAIIGETYGGGPWEFYNLLREWVEGDMDGLELS
jgi:cation diffusion facilitator CzcD-associated flavoprotein CzcO